ncbi:ommochrome-binding protein-like [Ostrinia furnacalis]|uniref:ommochrome-binding protein-like n=1 Tax=Ostrinia furnacalis TaxID=93504 RepID=UPI00103AFEE8|nr:ommochrome-binding protein-like [Ostrinia furnacalis]XP_028161264.1 ommochrome-binding protein-like [Ostrinia furnacalis]XP_028161265.1 ommochrome-binding protein-like [Ostrinia furnacalis]
MKLALVLAILTIAKAGVIKEETTEKPCDGVLVNGVYHEKDVIKEDLDRPYMLAIDNKTGTLYFSYSVKENDDVFKSARINLETKEFNDIDIVNGFAQTIDAANHIVYIGSNNGIYQYYPNTDTAEYFGQRGADIWAIYFKDALYFSEFPSQFLYTFINGTAVRFRDLEDTKVDHFIIDKDDDMFYTNATGLYAQKKGTKDAVLYEEFPHVGPRGVATDVNGNVYVCLRDGIFAVDKTEHSLKKAVDVHECFGIAFDVDNNIVYADYRSIVRLKPNKEKSC